MSRLNQQWHAFSRWLNETEPTPASRGTESMIVLREPIMLTDLRDHLPPRIGLVCPRCGGQIVRSHRRGDASCLQCGFEPIEKRPASYVFEPYEDQQATSRAALLPVDHRHGPVTIRRIEPLATDTCIKCGRTLAEDETMRVHRCADCYREYLSAIRLRAI